MNDIDNCISPPVASEVPLDHECYSVGIKVLEEHKLYFFIFNDISK